MSLQQARLQSRIRSLPRNKLYQILALASIVTCLFYVSRFGYYSNFLGAKRVSTSVVGKVTVLFGEPNPTYERALMLQKVHAERNAHPSFICRENILSGLWTKPAFILSVILAELAKPENERLQWLFRNDADVVLMNPKISLDIFIPPSPEFDYVNLLKTHDRHGLNNGVFLIKINEWSVKLLTRVLAFRHFRPLVELKYNHQSAMEEVLKDGSMRETVIRVPQHWFNAYPASARENAIPRAHEFRAGDLQIHFARNRDGKQNDRMSAWIDIAEQQNSEWILPPEQSGLKDAISMFWQNRTADRLAEATALPDLETVVETKLAGLR